MRVLSVQNQRPIETLRANGPHKPFGHAIGLRNTLKIRHALAHELFVQLDEVVLYAAGLCGAECTRW